MQPLKKVPPPIIITLSVPLLLSPSIIHCRFAISRTRTTTMRPICYAVLIALSLVSTSFCLPQPIKVNVNNQSAEFLDATTLAPQEQEETVTPGHDDPTTTGGTITITASPSTVPSVPTLKPSTSTVTPPNSTTTSTTTTTTTTVAPTNGTTVVPNPTTPSLKPTESPIVSTTASPHSKGRHFDGPSFIGGIVLACGLTAIGFVCFKLYKARTERNYHTLNDAVVFSSVEPQMMPSSSTNPIFLPKTYYD